jgi:hypothetical protein
VFIVRSFAAKELLGSSIDDVIFHRKFRAGGVTHGGGAVTVSSVVLAWPGTGL